MKYLLITVLCSGLFCNILVADGVLKEIGLALEAGNAKALANYFRGEVTLTVPKGDGAYKPAQAEEKLRNFFKENPPNQFITLHQGSSKSNSKYVIGKLKTANGNYRTYLLLYEGDQNQQPQIRELEFE